MCVVPFSFQTLVINSNDVNPHLAGNRKGGVALNTLSCN